MLAKRFVFRLQTVLELKIKKEDEEKKKLGDLIAWQKQEEQILAQLVATEQSTRAYLKEKQATGQWIEVDELKRISYYLKKVAGEIEAQKQKLIEIARRIDRKSTRLNSSHIPLSRMPSSA